MESTSASNSLPTAVSRCFASGEYSDLTIKCGLLDWKVHRVIVCPQSPVLYAAFEGSFTEAANKVINLQDDDPVMVNLMLTFLYSADYDWSPELSGITPLKLHAQMYRLADKYQIPGLINLSRDKYAGVLQTNPNLEDYLLSIPEVYLPLASGKGLRAVATEFARKSLRTGMQQENVKKHFRQVVDEVPEYGFDVLEIFINSPLRGQCRRCGDDQDAENLKGTCRTCGVGLRATY